MTQIEILDDFNSSSAQKTTKQSLIEHLPPVLMISLKRFVYDIKQNRTLKVDSHIQFGSTLEIPTECLALSKSYVYKLFAGTFR
jgi:ubiquitin C-terminal hydrolase